MIPFSISASLSSFPSSHELAFDDLPSVEWRSPVTLGEHVALVMRTNHGGTAIALDVVKLLVIMNK